MTSPARAPLWSDEQYAAYELGMQTEREHQNALSRLIVESHEAALLAAAQREEALGQRIAALEGELIETLGSLLSWQREHVHEWGYPLSEQVWSENPQRKRYAELTGKEYGEDNDDE